MHITPWHVPIVLVSIVLTMTFAGCTGPKSADKLAFDIGGEVYTSAPEIEAALERRAPEASSFVIYAPAGHALARQGAAALLVDMVQRFPDTPGRLAELPESGLPPQEGENELRIVVRPRSNDLE